MECVLHNVVQTYMYTQTQLRDKFHQQANSVCSIMILKVACIQSNLYIMNLGYNEVPDMTNIDLRMYMHPELTITFWKCLDIVSRQTPECSDIHIFDRT